MIWKVEYVIYFLLARPAPENSNNAMMSPNIIRLPTGSCTIVPPLISIIMTFNDVVDDEATTDVGMRCCFDTTACCGIAVNADVVVTTTTRNSTKSFWNMVMIVGIASGKAGVSRL